MSWSFKTEQTSVSAAAGAIDKAVEHAKANHTWSDEAEKKASHEQIDAAAEAAKSLASSGVAGGNDRTVVIEASGHANANHEPKSGMANDQVRVSVLQQS